MAEDRWIELPAAPASPESRVRPIRAPRPEPRPELQESLSIVWRHKWSIVAVTLLCLAVALVVSSRRTPIYESRARVLVTPIDFGSADVAAQDPNMDTEVELVSSVAVAEIVAKELKLEGAPRKLLDDLSVDLPTGTEILEISYRDPDPARAQAMAEGFAEGYLKYRQETANQKVLEAAKDLQTEISVLKQNLQKTTAELVAMDETDPRRGELEGQVANLRNLILLDQLALLDLRRVVTVGRVIEPAPLPSSPGRHDLVVSAAFGLAAGLAL